LLAEPINEGTPAELFCGQRLDRRPGVNTMSVPDVGKPSNVGTATADSIQKLVFKRHVTPRDPADHAFNTLTADEDEAKQLTGRDQIMARAKLRDQVFGIRTPATRAAHQTSVREGEHDDEDDDDEEHGLVSSVPGHKRSDLQHGFLNAPMLCKLPEWVAVTDDFLERAVLGVVDFMLGVNKSRTRLNAKGRFMHIDVHGEPWYVVTREQLANWLRIDNPTRVRHAVDRLVRKEFLHNVTHTRGRTRNAVAMRLRLNWPKIEEAYQHWLAEWKGTEVG
jgi:hypothetical protein